MAMTYKVIVSVAEPTETEKCLIWIQPAAGAAYIMIGSWAPWVAGDPIASYTEGKFTRKFVKQDTAPDTALGQLWLDTKRKQEWIYLSGWLPVFGI